MKATEYRASYAGRILGAACVPVIQSHSRTTAVFCGFQGPQKKIVIWHAYRCKPQASGITKKAPKPFGFEAF